MQYNLEGYALRKNEYESSFKFGIIGEFLEVILANGHAYGMLLASSC